MVVLFACGRGRGQTSEQQGQQKIQHVVGVYVGVGVGVDAGNVWKEWWLEPYSLVRLEIYRYSYKKSELNTSITLSILSLCDLPHCWMSASLVHAHP